jgi:hypothetical protein
MSEGAANDTADREGRLSSVPCDILGNIPATFCKVLGPKP